MHLERFLIISYTCTFVWCCYYPANGIQIEAITSLVNNSDSSLNERPHDSSEFRRIVPKNHRASDDQEAEDAKNHSSTLSEIHGSLVDDKFLGYESSKDFLNSIDEPANLISPSEAISIKWSPSGREEAAFAPIAQADVSKKINRRKLIDGEIPPVQFDDDDAHNKTQSAFYDWRDKSPLGIMQSNSRFGDQTNRSPSSFVSADDSGSFSSLDQAHKALEDNLALQDQLMLLLNRVKSNTRRNNMTKAVISGIDFMPDSASHKFGVAELAGHDNLIPETNNSHFHHHLQMATPTATTTRTIGQRPDKKQLHRPLAASRSFYSFDSGSNSKSRPDDVVAATNRQFSSATPTLPEYTRSPALRLGFGIRSPGPASGVSSMPRHQSSRPAVGSNVRLIAAPSSLDAAPVSLAGNNLVQTRFSPREESAQSSFAPDNQRSVVPFASGGEAAHLQHDVASDRYPGRQSGLVPVYNSTSHYGPVESHQDDEGQEDAADETEGGEQDGIDYYQPQLQVYRRRRRPPPPPLPQRQFVASDQLSGASQKRKQSHRGQANLGRPVFKRANPRRRNNGMPLPRPVVTKVSTSGGAAHNKYAIVGADDGNWFYDYPNQMTSSAGAEAAAAVAPAGLVPHQQRRLLPHHRQLSSSPSSSLLSPAPADWISAADYNPNPSHAPGAVGAGGASYLGSSDRFVSQSGAIDQAAAGLSARLSPLAKNRDFREALPSYQVVHIHSKDKKSYGKYLWPIVGGGLTMLMGFLIISNILLSIPLLAIGASSLFSNNQGSLLGGYHSQQLVPVYNLSALITTRAPSGRRRRRRRRRRDLSAGRDWSGRSKCQQNRFDWDAEKMAAGLWLLAREL